MRRTLVWYALLVTAFVGAIVAILGYGARLEAGRATAVRAVPAPEAAGLTPLATLLTQIVVVVVAARLCGRLSARIGQPKVIGEIVAGILLGPSLLGWAAPGVSRALFPPSSLGTLKLLADVGVLLFMFVVGLEVDLDRLRGRAHTAVVVSHASILLPYLLGVALSLSVYRSLAPEGVRFVPFALFMGIAMSITAFPVLARILEERGLTKTPLGSTAITCAAVDDITAWSLLALVVAVAKAQGIASSGFVVLMTAGFIALMWYVVGPAVRAIIGRGESSKGTPSKNVLAFVLLLLIGSALTTERIGIHALFGAFLIGVVMPREASFRAALVQRLEEVSAVLFLPLFFAFTGLRTQIGLVDSAESWLTCLAIIGVATAGKLGGSMAAARLSGMETLDAFSLGALMNTRGLMELIVLNVGYELGILSPRIFAMMVLMALVTTFSTAPLLSLADSLRKRRRDVPAAAASA
ncbi:MAG TPA: cation:proton antiporter [Thermoanaerobaculia bacterium]|nr:cation:proton antiporter [Thermoanaerobaculia bacterium]